MVAGNRVAPKRKPRRFMPEWKIELHRQTDEGDVTQSTGFDVMGSDRAHARWFGGKMIGSPADLVDETDIEFVTGIALTTSLPRHFFGDAVGEEVAGDPESEATLGTIGIHARQGWFIYLVATGHRYRIQRVDRLPDGRAMIRTMRMRQ